MNRVDEQAILKMEILHTLEPYVGPGELAALAERLATANYADLRSISLRATRAAETFRQIVEPTRVGRRVLPADPDSAETGFTIRQSGYTPRIRHDDRCQDESVSCCERLRALEAALDCIRMDVSLKDDAFIGERADYLADRLRRQPGVSQIRHALLVYSESRSY